MSCNGCRVLRKGCSDTCILRSSLHWIDSPEAQGNATVFVAKFFGRAGMLSFINAVAESQRPALFQSLLYEACGRTVNPVFGAVGLLWSGNWATCQAAVETVLKGGTLKPAACPPCTEPLYKWPGNPSPKRPASVTEHGVNPTVEAKKIRSSISPEESPEFTEEARIGCANHIIPVRLPEPGANTARNSEVLTSSGAASQAQRPAPSASLVVPVARRVKPPCGFGLASKFVARDQQQAVSQESDRKNHGVLELDLSLNSQAYANANTMATERGADDREKVRAQHNGESHEGYISRQKGACHEEEHASCIGFGRSSSPCSFSINSEGSVASVDTTAFSISGIPGLVASQLRQEDYHLLHLL